MMKENRFESNKKLVSRKEFLVGSGAVIAAIALTACGSKTTNSTTTNVATTTLQQTATPTSASSPLTPKYGGTLRFISGAFANNIGWPADYTANMATFQLSCDTLLRWDNEGNVIPWLAESYKLADDRKSITFSLRKGVKFHDGSDFNAEVAKWNLDNFIDAGMQANWASVDALDDYTIRVKFTEWQNTLLSTFVKPTFPVYHDFQGGL